MVIVPLMMLLLGSLRLGLVSILPNLLPIAAGAGVMPLLGISLNPGTVMVAAVALGVIVDDTVHLLAAMRRQRENDIGLAEAFARGIEEVGGPVLVTSAVLVGSLAVLTFGSFAPGIHFGMIAIVIVLMALLADLFLLPRIVSLAGSDSPGTIRE